MFQGVLANLQRMLLIAKKEIMTTQEIANRLVELCGKGEYQTCYQELYSPEIVSVEADGSSVKGFDEIQQKGKEWNAGIEAFHGSSIGAPAVSGNYFSVPMSMKIQYKGSPEVVQFEEICLYQVKEGKIVKEQFFYDAPAPE